MRSALFALSFAMLGLLGCGEQAPTDPGTASQVAPATDQAPPAQHGAGQGRRGKGAKGKGRKAPVGVAQAATPDGKPAVTFVINTHDWYFHERSAQTVGRAIDILEKYGVTGEFYFTAALFRAYQQHHPELLARMQSSGMTISYHVRAPHPVTFRGPLAKRLQAMPHDQAVALMTSLESHRLDLSTGTIDESKVGGYLLLKEALGYAPPVVAFNAKGDTLRDLELEAVAALGARMWMRKHTGDTMELSSQGLLSRPSQFAVSKVDGDNWWKTNKPYDPAVLFAGAQGYGVALIHEHDFYAQGPGWNEVYWTDSKQNKPPFDLTVRQQDHKRYPDAHVAQTWATWESLVAYASQNMRVVTSRDIIAEYDAQH